jgi:hypothetical protein
MYKEKDDDDGLPDESPAKKEQVEEEKGGRSRCERF